MVKPERRSLTATVDQPGTVEAFEQTAIYSMVSGKIKQYYGVDIGKHVKKGDPIVEIFVPDLDEDHAQKVEQVKLDRKMVEQAESKVQNAIAELAEKKADVGRYDAEIVKWESQVQRFTRMVEQRVVDRQDLEETQKQLSASIATREAALAAVNARVADLEKSKIDVETARAQVKVAEADERRIAAMQGYTKITAPYDGVITVRNANTGDYVQAATGDKSGTRAAPMFVIARDDKVRIFVDVPEGFARYVSEGTKATVRAAALSGLEIKAAVTRTSWSVMEKTRTLLAEIDLPTEDINGLRPGDYVKATVIVERPHIAVLPLAALAVSGNQTYCYLLQDGKAVKTYVVPGLKDGTSVEVAKMKIGDQWVKVSGDEEVILGNLDELTDGQAVKVEQAAGR